MLKSAKLQYTLAIFFAELNVIEQNICQRMKQVYEQDWWDMDDINSSPGS